jgi:anhydro-N-acetylmuramic acid kinase
MKEKQKYRCIGLMSGTSLDGLDIVFCEFSFCQEKWEYRLLKGKTIPYPEAWRDLLEGSFHMEAAELVELDHNYGKFLGAVCSDFITDCQADPSFIASHGHTVFHRPDAGYSLQIGNGHDIAAVTDLPVIYDFRSHDISLGGQGAPLVPAGDRLLFGDFDICLNIGGFANISFDNEEGQRIAFDICPSNTILNYIAGRLDMPYDRDGLKGREGRILKHLLEKLNGLPYYAIKPPKSLGYEYLDTIFFPLIRSRTRKPENILRTLYEHIAIQIAEALKIKEGGKVLLTGGGARNSFLVELIKSHTDKEIIIPGDGLADFKEAIVFAFLGLLRMLGENNCFASVTGASSDCSGGLIVWPGREN